MNIICFGQQDWSRCWTGKQQLLTRLARRGHRILYVDPTWSREPRRLPDELRVLVASRPPGLREVGPGTLFVHRHAFLPSLGWRLNVRMHRVALARLVRTLHLEGAVALVMRPDDGDRVDAVRPAARIYFAVDEWTAFPGYRDGERERMRREEEEHLTKSHLALGVSPRLVRRFGELCAHARLLQNGADCEHLGPASLARALPDPEIDALPGPRLGFVGQVDERLDQELLRAIARARPRWSIVLVGRHRPGADLASLAELPNVHVAGYRPYEDLPAVMRCFDACIAPYRRTPLTESCSPLKVWDYLATGHPVVATGLEGLGEAARVVATPEGALGWIAALEAALADPRRGRAERLAVARAGSWEQRADELEEHLEAAHAIARAAARPHRIVEGALPGRALARLPDPPERFHDYGKSLADERAGRALTAAFAVTRAAGTALALARRAGRLLAGRPSRIRKVLVVRNAFLGDALALVPALSELRAHRPDTRIVLGVQPGMRSGALLLETGLVDEVRELGFLGASARGKRLAGLARLFAEGFDAVLSSQHYFLRREAFLAGAPLRLGVWDGHPLQRWNTLALPLDRNRHEADVGLDLVELLCRAPVERGRAHRLDLGGARLESADAAVRGRLALGDDGDELVLMHPGATKATRRWPAERFGELAARILTARPRARVVFTGIADERGLVELAVEAIPEDLRGRVTDAAGATELFELAALLGKSALAVCNDTGTMHLARALGTPLVALLGPENDRRWGPTPRGAAPAVALRHVVPCAPCARTSCADLWCMRALGVDEVAREALSLLARPRAAAIADEQEEGALVRLRVHESWQSLAEAGYRLPRVAVLAPLSAGDPLAAQMAVATALAGVAGQSYPALELVVVTDPSDPSRELGCEGLAASAAWPGGPGVRWISAGGDPRARIRAALEASDAELWTVLDPDTPWTGERTGLHVAALVARPDALHAGTPGAALDRADLTVRRAALQAALDASPEVGEAATESAPTLARAFAAVLASSGGPRVDALAPGARRGGQPARERASRPSRPSERREPNVAVPLAP